MPHHFTTHGFIMKWKYQNTSICLTLYKTRPVNNNNFSPCILQKLSHFSSESISIIVLNLKWENQIKYELPANYSIGFQIQLLCIIIYKTWVDVSVKSFRIYSLQNSFDVALGFETFESSIKFSILLPGSAGFQCL